MSSSVRRVGLGMLGFDDISYFPCFLSLNIQIWLYFTDWNCNPRRSGWEIFLRHPLRHDHFLLIFRAQWTWKVDIYHLGTLLSYDGMFISDTVMRWTLGETSSLWQGPGVWQRKGAMLWWQYLLVRESSASTRTKFMDLMPWHNSLPIGNKFILM